ncbi:glycosyltransferase family 61 protein [Gluconobacter morbifer]|uniref:Glycosyltransferase 61 catalytic domain-containing protein n=1 Tax=Gluconobacter morbifer G707 TaxID=1088869 RepID=G6XL71_9PROT|nr:glycosyltransferase 61 family protein [Gluconobacter morbifer]EHH67499.1 hypothetical protein GMO_24940 [Gluconobacter morbifer G707]
MVFNWLKRKKPPSPRLPSAPLTLETAASYTIEMERTDSHLPRLVQDGRLPDGTASLFRDWRSTPLTLRQFVLENVVLDRSLMVFLKDGRPIVDTAYLQSPADVQALTVRPECLVAAPKKQPVMAACFDHWNLNYYHWLAHTVPTLFILHEKGFPGSLILPSLTPWQEDTLRLSGFDPDNSVTTHHGQQYAFRKVIYTDYVRGAADFSVSTRSCRAYRALTARAGVKRGTARTLKIFIARGNASNRLMANETELAFALKQEDFTIVQPETLNINAQIHLFSQARMVVGALGAGMANVVWCQPGTIVCELVPQHHQNPCILNLTIQMGLLYWGELIETGVDTSSHVSVGLRPFDIPLLVHRIRQLAAFIR